jgi:hypothetical protein
MVGTLCIGAGVPDDVPHTNDRHLKCRSFCKSDADCISGDAGVPRCLGFAENNPSPPEAAGGVCVPSCTLLSDECGPKATCAAVVGDSDGTSQFSICHAIGPGTEFSSCTGRTDCGADLDCVATTPFGGSGVCTFPFLP